ncbi:MAG TPA: hypothetical protein VE912_02315 [Bacteroidales bacterium]|nr:hypothetical protein [Bacteroidales bacterium]
MTKEEKLALSFKIAGINTEEFAIVEDEFNEKEPSKLGAAINFGINEENQIIGIRTKFQFEQKGKPFLIIAVACDFEIEKKAWNNLFDKESNSILLPEGFASHLAMLTVGTTRGVLHEKTNNTPFNRFILPPINLTKLIKEDVTIKLEKEAK